MSNKLIVMNLVVMLFGIALTAVMLATPPAPKCTVQKAEVMMTEGDSVWTEVMDVCM